MSLGGVGETLRRTPLTQQHVAGSLYLLMLRGVWRPCCCEDPIAQLAPHGVGPLTLVGCLAASLDGH
jgi:hypothetical protein